MYLQSAKWILSSSAVALVLLVAVPSARAVSCRSECSAFSSSCKHGEDTKYTRCRRTCGTDKACARDCDQVKSVGLTLCAAHTDTCRNSCLPLSGCATTCGMAQDACLDGSQVTFNACAQACSDAGAVSSCYMSCAMSQKSTVGVCKGNYSACAKSCPR